MLIDLLFRTFLLFIASGVLSASDAYAKEVKKTPPLGSESNSFTVGNDTYRITASGREVTEPNTYESVAVAYSVYKNGKIVHRADRGGGNTWGCLYGNKRSPEDFLKPLKFGDVQVGWRMDLLGICGNTTSRHEHWVLLWDPQEVSSQPSYYTKDFISKYNPIVNVLSAPATPAKVLSGLRAEIWYVYQEWGKAGTAGSYFVPVRFGLTFNKSAYSPLETLKLPPDVATWPKFDNMEHSKASVVTAGIVALDSAPIRTAAKTISKEDREHLEYVGLPTTTEELTKLADAIEVAGPMIRDFRH